LKLHIIMLNVPQGSSNRWRQGKSPEKVQKTLVAAAKVLLPHIEVVRPLFEVVTEGNLKVLLDALTRGGSPGAVAELLTAPHLITELGGSDVAVTAPTEKALKLVLPSCIVDGNQRDAHGLGEIEKEVVALLGKLDIEGAKGRVVSFMAGKNQRVEVDYAPPSLLNDKQFVASLVAGVPKGIVSMAIPVIDGEGGGFTTLIEGPRSHRARISGPNKKLVGHIARRFMAFGASQELRGFAEHCGITVEEVTK